MKLNQIKLKYLNYIYYNKIHLVKYRKWRVDKLFGRNNMKTIAKSLCFFEFFIFLSLGLLFSPAYNTSVDISNQIPNIDDLSISATVDEKMYDWNTTIGGANREKGIDMVVNGTDSIYLLGETKSLGAGLTDAYLIKITTGGSVLWSKTWGGKKADYGTGVAFDSYGNLYITGYTESMGAGEYDMFLSKYNKFNVNLWNKTWGSTKDDRSRGIVVDSNDDIYVTGYTENTMNGKFDMVLIKYDLDGNELWSATYGDSDKDDFGYALTLDSSDNIYVGGSTESAGAGSLDFAIVTFNSSGSLKSLRTWGGPGDDEALAIANDTSNNFYLTGYTESYGASLKDIAVAKFSSAGAARWNTTWRGTLDDVGQGIDVDSGGNAYVTGYTESYGAGLKDVCILKYTSLGGHLWNKTWGGALADEGFDISAQIANKIYVLGYLEVFGAGSLELCLIRYGVDTDGDGLSDWRETSIYKTNPELADTDGDGYSDYDEILGGTNPLDALSSPLTQLLMRVIIIVGIGIAFIVVVIVVRKKLKSRPPRERRVVEEDREIDIAAGRARADKARAEREQIKKERESREGAERAIKEKEQAEKEQELQSVMKIIEKLIQELDFANAIAGLNDIIVMSKEYELTKVIKWARKSIKVCEAFDNIVNLLRISKKTKIEDLASILDMDRTFLLKNLIKGAQSVQFFIDGEFLEIEQENLVPFIRLLETYYATWLEEEREEEITPEIKAEKIECVVCKGEIKAVAYYCTGCPAVYHLKCANSLKDVEDNCWQCQTPFPALPKPVEDEGVIDKKKKKKKKK